MQGFKSQRRPSLRESKLRVGNDLEVSVESMGDVSLALGTGYELVLKDTFYVPSFRRNLISVSCLDKLGFHFSFGDRKLNLMLNFEVVGYGYLMDGLYKLSIVSDNVSSSLNVKMLLLKGLKLRKSPLCYGISD